MPSSTFRDKMFIGEKRYKKLELISSSNRSFRKPSFKKISNDVEVFDNGVIIVRYKGDWWELK